MSLAHLESLNPSRHNLHTPTSNKSQIVGKRGVTTPQDDGVGIRQAISALSSVSDDLSLSEGNWCQRNILYRTEPYAMIIFISIAGIGMLWSSLGILLNEIGLNIEQDLKVLGYILTFMRVGKVLGHMAIVPVSKWSGGRMVEVHILSLFVVSGLTVIVPFCTSWVLLSMDWFLLGALCGFIESNIVMINELLNGPNRVKFTNVYYALYSLGTVVSSFIMESVKNESVKDGIRNDADDYKHILLHSYLVIAAYIAILTIPVILMLLLRRQKGLIVLDTSIEGDEFDESRSGSMFRWVKISFSLLLLSAFFFVAAQSCLWVYVLTFAKNSNLDLDESQEYCVAQTFFVASMTIRFIAAILTFFYRNTVVTLAVCNFVLASASILLAILQDGSYNQLLFLMVLFGIGMGLFQNSLLNWLTDHVVLTPKNSFPFFVASTLGQIMLPSIVPHIILDNNDKFIPEHYMWILSVLAFIPVVLTTILMTIESSRFPWGKQEVDIVKDINIIPVSVLSNVPSALLDESGGAVSSMTFGTAVTKGSSAAILKSRMSVTVSKIDPVVSFLSIG